MNVYIYSVFSEKPTIRRWTIKDFSHIIWWIISNQRETSVRINTPDGWWDESAAAPLSCNTDFASRKNWINGAKHETMRFVHRTHTHTHHFELKNPFSRNQHWMDQCWIRVYASTQYFNCVRAVYLSEKHEESPFVRLFFCNFVLTLIRSVVSLMLCVYVRDRERESNHSEFRYRVESGAVHVQVFSVWIVCMREWRQRWWLAD